MTQIDEVTVTQATTFGPLVIGAGAMLAIKAHAMRVYPEECCGLLLGRDRDDGTRTCERAFTSDNAAAQRSRGFEIMPDVLLKGEAEAARHGLLVLGVYHSHPAGPAVPSDTDLEHAQPFWSYVIVGRDEPGAMTVRSWRLRDDRSCFDEEVIEAPDAPAPAPDPKDLQMVEAVGGVIYHCPHCNEQRAATDPRMLVVLAQGAGVAVRCKKCDGPPFAVAFKPPQQPTVVGARAMPNRAQRRAIEAQLRSVPDAEKAAKVAQLLRQGPR